jgi:hypothetical protein
MSEAGTPSEELRSIRVNLASRQICLSHLSHLEKFLTSDKLCVGHPYGNALNKILLFTNCIVASKKFWSSMSFQNLVRLSQI